MGRFSTVEQVDYAIERIRSAVDKVRELSPLWEMFQEGIDISKVEWVSH